MKTLLRKPTGILLPVLCLSLFAAIPVKAQNSALYNYLGHDDPPTAGVPGAQLAQEARSDIYAHNYAAAVPLLEKGVQLGNSDAMGYLSFCYFYGYGVPVDRGRAMQLMRTLTMTAQRRAIRIDKEQQEERERAAREFARQLSENAESRTAFSSTDRPTPKPKKTPGMFVITPYGIKLRNSFNTIWDNNGQTSP